MLPSKTAVNQDAGDSPQNASAQPAWTLVSAFTLTLLAAGGTALRFLFLARKPFWFDEAFSVEVARLSWYDFIRLLWWREANMSLYYVLLRGWLHLGSSPFFIRSLSVLASLATLSSGLFVACEREPSSSERNRRRYVLASVLAVYAHFYALLLVAAQWLSVRGLKGMQESGKGVANPPALRRAWIWIGVAVLPLLAFVGKTGAGQIKWIPRPGFHELLDYGEHLTGNDGLPLLLLYAAACLAAILPLRGRLFRLGAGWDVWRCQFLLTWLLFPVALALLLSLAHPVFVARYFTFCLPALILLAAAGLANLRKPWMMAVCLAAILLLSLQGTSSYYDHDFDLGRDGSQAAANYVCDHAQPGDAILFHISEGRVPYEFVRSLRGEDWRNRPAAGPEIIFPRHGDHLDYRDVTGKPTSEFLRSMPGQYARLWVVLMSNGAPDHPDATTLMLSQILGESFSRMERVQFPEVEVRLYSKR